MHLTQPAFFDWLHERVERRKPTAAVRFGDAEARLLIADGRDEASLAEASRKLTRESGLELTQSDVLEIGTSVALAFDQADVLGIDPSEEFTDGHKAWLAELAEIHSARVAAGRAPVPIAHCLFSHQILDRLPQLLRGRCVSAITCRDLRPTLEGQWGLKDVRLYQMPSQYSTRDVDGRFEAAMHDVPIWPDAHDDIKAELAVRERGEVFLVGAGLFGKDLCIRIRDLGGIALDMGSILDMIAGKVTRGPERLVFDMHAGGMPIGDIATELQARFQVEVGSGWIAKIIEPAVAEIEKWRRRPLNATYASVLFDRVEIEVGVEEKRSCLLAIGIDANDRSEALGLWWEGSDGKADAVDNLRQRGLSAVSFTHSDSGFASSNAVRRAVDKHGPFEDEQAASNLIFLAFIRAESRRRKAGPSGSTA